MIEFPSKGTSSHCGNDALSQGNADKKDRVLCVSPTNLPLVPHNVPLYHEKAKRSGHSRSFASSSSSSSSFLNMVSCLLSQKLLSPLRLHLPPPSLGLSFLRGHHDKEKRLQGPCFQDSIKALSFYLVLNGTLHRQSPSKAAWAFISSPRSTGLCGLPCSRRPQSSWCWWVRSVQGCRAQSPPSPAGGCPTSHRHPSPVLLPRGFFNETAGLIRPSQFRGEETKARGLPDGPA